MAKKPSKELTALLKDLRARLIKYEATSAIMVHVRIFDAGEPEQEDPTAEWEVLVDKKYGPEDEDKHRLKIGRMAKGGPHG